MARRLPEQGHIVLAGCSKREDWLNAIDLALADAEAKAGDSADVDQTTRGPGS